MMENVWIYQPNDHQYQRETVTGKIGKKKNDYRAHVITEKETW